MGTRAVPKTIRTDKEKAKMRSIKLTTAIAAAASLLCMAPALAAAAGRHAGRRDRPASGCRVSLAVAPRMLYAGQKATAVGVLSCAEAGAAGAQSVTLYEGSLVTPGYTVAGTATTEANGAYKIETTSPLSANSRFYVLAGSAQSPYRTVKVIALVTLKGPAEGAQLQAGLRTGRRNTVVFTGTVSPADIGAEVVLQRQDALTGNEWHRIGGGLVAAGANPTEGTFSIRHTFVVPGDANVRVLLRSQRRNVASPSNVLTYEISQAQNAAITIHSSADPITYGQPVTISGAIAAGSGATATLLARTIHQRGFAPVAEVKANAQGDYEFPAQSPIDSTLYEVQSNGRSSAVLYEGVRDVLTASVAPGTSVQVGQTLTFSGTVSPERNGHVIYLEREDGLHPGFFHVVEISTITGTTYSIEHTVYEVGTSVFRVRIPGDAQNGGGASQPFTITVAPAPSASAVTPEAPGNSTLPAEGQV
jgi:hypothetical protein